MNNNQIIRDLIDEALEILQRIKIDYNSPLGPNTSALIQVVEELNSYVRISNPRICEIQEYALAHIVHNKRINAYSFGDLRTTIRILDALYPHAERKIFISHSSKDEKIIRQFTKDILIAGCGLRPNEIFCTLDNSTIHTGEDFRNEIVRGMKECNFILLMISNNYKESEVCQNEMGAAWALEGKTILPFVLPDCSFENMGFVYKVKQGASIIDKTKLDELYNDICGTYNIEQDWLHFNQCKEDFVNGITASAVIGSTNNRKDNKQMQMVQTQTNDNIATLSDWDKEHLKAWVDSGELEGYSLGFIGDGYEYILGTKEYLTNDSEEILQWDDFFERMQELKFITLVDYDKYNNPCYKLKKAAVDYVRKYYNDK